MTEATPHVFLSYARADRSRVAKIAEALTAAGLSVWWDTAIETGSRFSTDIERELNAADVVVVVWSAASVNSAWVLDEAGAGRDRGRLVPVQIDATLPPLGFRQYQATDLLAWKGRASDPKFVALVSAIKKMAGSEAATPPAPPTAPAANGPSRRALIGGAAGVAALAAGGFGAWKFLGQKADDGTASVVVLPFANLSGDPAQAFFSDGIAEELRSALSQIAGLKVIGRASSEKFRDTADLSGMAAQLGVANVLTGSVRRSGTTARISAQLTDSKSGVEIWSQSYDRPAGDVLDIQSSIATSVVGALSPRLSKAAGKLLVGGTDNVEAQALYFQASADDPTDAASAAKGIARLDAAIALDPDYALAHAGKARILSFLSGTETDSSQARELRAQAVASARRAVEVAPKSGRALANYSTYELGSLKFRAAVADAERGVQLEPGNADALAGAARTLRAVNPTRADVLAGRAIALDPFSARAFEGRAEALMNLRRFDDTVVAARKAIDLSNGSRGGTQLFVSLVMLGRLAEARPLIAKVDLWRVAARTALLEARAGNRVAGDAALAALDGYALEATSYARAQIHAQRGDLTTAMAALEEAAANQSQGLSNIAFDPFLDPLRSDPRFKTIQDKIIPSDLLTPKRRA